MSNTYRIHLRGTSSNETFRIKLLERQLRPTTKVWVEGFFIHSNYLSNIADGEDGIICIRSSVLQDKNDYDTRTDRQSKLIGKFVRGISSGIVYYQDFCLCDLNAGYLVNDLGCLHGSIDIQITRENGDLTAISGVGCNWSMDLLFIEPIDD